MSASADASSTAGAASGSPDAAPRGSLAGWRRSWFAGDGITHEVFERGEGPGVVLVPEIPGMTPEVLGLADHLVEEGFTVVMPSLFGRPGAEGTIGATLRTAGRVCVSAEFQAFARRAERPVARFLRALAHDLAGRTPGRGVGVIGMCFTGGFALAAAVDESVTAPVLSQPSVPFPLGESRRRDAGVSDRELGVLKERVERDGLCMLGLRFSEDSAAPADRMSRLRAEFGDAFEVIELDSSPGNDGGFRSTAHSVLTGEVRERAGHPALQARARVVDFLRERTAPAQAAQPSQPAQPGGGSEHFLPTEPEDPERQQPTT